MDNRFTYRKVKHAPDAKITTYIVKFDFLGYDLSLPYHDDMSEEDVVKDLEHVYGELRRQNNAA